MMFQTVDLIYYCVVYCKKIFFLGNMRFDVVVFHCFDLVFVAGQ